jgi:hypothetical protein
MGREPLAVRSNRMLGIVLTKEARLRVVQFRALNSSIDVTSGIGSGLRGDSGGHIDLDQGSQW